MTGVLLLCGSALSAVTQASEIIQGRVLQAGNAQLSVRTADGRAQVFSVRSGAIITLNDMRTMLEDLRPGYPVTVATSVGRVAVRIDAKSFGGNPGCNSPCVQRPRKTCRRAAVIRFRRR
jgi:hypothetical protein